MPGDERMTECQQEIRVPADLVSITDGSGKKRMVVDYRGRIFIDGRSLFWVIWRNILLGIALLSGMSFAFCVGWSIL